MRLRLINYFTGADVKTASQSGFLFAVVSICLFAGCQKKVSVPGEFKEWNSSDGAFALSYPSEWRAQGGVYKDEGSSWAKFEKDGVSIRVDASFTQSVLGDLMGGAGDTTDLPDDLRPEAKLHDHNLDFYKEHYRDYEEVSITTKELPIGRTRIAEFKATKGLSKLCGIRATATTRDKGITFRAYAPRANGKISNLYLIRSWTA